MRYLKRFDAHLDMADFRTNLTAAGGCVWPTIPAVRYLITSDNPSGIFEFLATEGALVQRTNETTAHDQAQWGGPLNDVPLTWVILQKTMLFDKLSWQWLLAMSHPLCPTPLVGVWSPFVGRCNKDAVLGNLICSTPSAGETGNDLQIRQVEWDQTVPPEGYP